MTRDRRVMGGSTAPRGSVISAKRPIPGTSTAYEEAIATIRTTAVPDGR